jgi:AraC-like DNA-binding protein
MAGRRPRLTLLNAAALARCCRRAHLQLSADLAPFAVVCWTLQWSLARGEAFVQKVLPDPCVLIVVEENGIHLQGVVTGSYSATLQGDGFVLGLKFRPGGFYPFVNRPVAEFTDRRVPLAHLLPSANEEGLRRLAGKRDGPAVLSLLEDTLRSEQHLRTGSTFWQVCRIADRIAADPTLLTVECAAEAFSLSPRSLQRLFRTYVGVSPKWMIRRRRLQEAAALVETGSIQDWAALAVELGYFDQAHFINDFANFVGQSPASYASSIGKCKES